MTPLERRYRWLLVTYPLEHRRDHESEMLGTLLEAASPAQRWPSAREGAALLVGGLRTRARLAAASPQRLWADGLRLGALLLFLTAGLDWFAILVAFSPLGRLKSHLGHPETVLLEALLCVGAVVALVRGRYRVGFCAVAGILALQLVIYKSGPPIPSPVSAVGAGWVLAGLIIALLASRRSLKVASHAWSWRLALLLLAAFVPATLTQVGLIWSSRTLSVGLLDALALASELLPAAVTIGLALLASDARFALGATLYIAIDVLGRFQTLVAASGFVYFPRSSYLLETLMILLLGGGITTLSILRTRRPATG